MKKFLLFSLVSMVSVMSYSLAQTKQEAFKNKAYQILVQNSSKLNVTGDAQPDDSVDSLLAQLKSSSKHDVKCETSTLRKAQCTLFFTTSAASETSMTFQILLDNNEMPKKIHGTTVEVAHVD